MSKVEKLEIPPGDILIRNIIQQPAGLVFLLLCMMQVLILYYQNEFIIPDELLYHSLGDKYSTSRIGDIIQYKNTTAVFRYIAIPANFLAVSSGDSSRDTIPIESSVSDSISNIISLSIVLFPLLCVTI